LKLQVLTCNFKFVLAVVSTYVNITYEQYVRRVSSTYLEV